MKECPALCYGLTRLLTVAWRAVAVLGDSAPVRYSPSPSRLAISSSLGSRTISPPMSRVGVDR
jgi:hypothetical protein